MVQFPPYSQTYLPGYLALKRLEFRDYFDRNHVQLPLSKGIWCFSTRRFSMQPAPIVRPASRRRGAGRRVGGGGFRCRACGTGGEETELMPTSKYFRLPSGSGRTFFAPWIAKNGGTE
jgi:hypothetical protein